MAANDTADGRHDPNSTFNGGCSKGMQLLGDSYGVQILHNEFADLRSRAAIRIHIGGIQLYGADTSISRATISTTTATGGRAVESTDGVTTADREQRLGLHLHLPVVDPGGGDAEHDCPAQHVRRRRRPPFLHQHGTGSRSATSSATTCSRIRPTASPGTRHGADRLGNHDHNLNAGVPGHGNLKGRPVFVGGKKPKSYQGYRLARGSRGKGAASDGGDLGIRARR